MKIRRLARFKKSYQRLSAKIQKKVDRGLTLLFSNPRHPSLQVRKLESHSSIWYIRVDLNHRLTFEFDEEGTLILRNVGSHDPTLTRP